MEASLWTLVVCILTSSQRSTVVAGNCDQGWFGPRCQYKCRFQNDNCDLDGSCKSGATCQGGWFGPECQYADMAYKHSRMAFPVVVDGNDSTCLNNVDSDFIKFDLFYPFLVNWLRTKISKPELLSTLKFDFGSDIKCSGNATVDRYTMDCYISTDKSVNYIHISGHGIRHMCSLHVSGGRSVASTQNASQRHFFLINHAMGDNVYHSAVNSVDGNREARKTDSCSISEEGVPRWNVSFTHPEMIVITRIVLYYPNEGDAYKALGKFLNLHEKPLTLERVQQSITKSIANNSDNTPNICEVDLYGESVCDPGWYGRDCEYRCNCAKSESCYVSTGGCYYGCAVGFKGENSKQTCFNNTYGKECATNCSQFCATNLTNPQSCHHNSGSCVFGCLQGYKGLTCQEPDDNESNFTAIWAVLAVAGGLLGVVLIYIYMRRRRKQIDKLRHIYINDNNRFDSNQPTYSNDSVKLSNKRQMSEMRKNPKTTEEYLLDENDYATIADYDLESASSDNQDEKPTEEDVYVETE